VELTVWTKRNLKRQLGIWEKKGQERASGGGVSRGMAGEDFNHSKNQGRKSHTIVPTGFEGRPVDGHSEGQAEGRGRRVGRDAYLVRVEWGSQGGNGGYPWGRKEKDESNGRTWLKKGKKAFLFRRRHKSLSLEAK